MFQQRLFPKDSFFGVIFIACLMFSLWAVSVGWGNTLLDQHGFRQTQTAISVFYLLRGSPFLTYETPVLGAPWSIPFEFPLYQYFVAILATVSNTPLDQAGRLISVLFFYVSLVPFYTILTCLKVCKQYRWVFLSLFITNPIYLFWSRTFMIESLALFLSLAYLASVGLYLSKKNTNILVLIIGSVLATLAALVKITTFFGFFLAAILWFFWAWYNNLKRSDKRLTFFYDFATPVFAFFAVPCTIGLGWTHFADTQRLLNPIAADYITSASLKRWTFGTLEQKISFETWSSLLGRFLAEIWGRETSVLILIFVICFFAFSFGKRKRIALISGFLFLAVIGTFTNLHLVHNYYQFANCIFFIAAIGFSILGLAEKNDTGKALGHIFLTIILVIQIHSYFTIWYPVANENKSELLLTANAIKRNTNSEDVLLIYGLDWSSELPYYSQRRALMYPTWVRDETWNQALQNLSGYRVGAMSLCGNAKNDFMGEKGSVNTYHFQPEPIYTDSICNLYLPEEDQ